MFDLVALTTIYGLTVGITAAIDDRIDNPSILVPAIGPFLLLDKASEDYTLILLLSGVLQTAFLFDHNVTMGKINRLSKDISISSNLNLNSPKVSLTYNF